jgi:hypothetical protein
MNILALANTTIKRMILGLGMVSLIASLLFMIPQVNAQYDPCEVFGNCLGGTEELANEDSDDLVVNLILGFSFFLIYVGGAVAVLFIILGGYKMVTASGNDTEYKNGRSMVINAVIGLVLIIVSVTIVSVVGSIVTGIEIPVFGG